MFDFDWEDFAETMVPLCRKALKASKVALHYGWLPFVLVYGETTDEREILI